MSGGINKGWNGGSAHSCMKRQLHLTEELPAFFPVHLRIYLSTRAELPALPLQQEAL